MSEYTVSGSVVVYNKPEDAVRTVDSIIRNTPPSFRLFVIDNDSAEKISVTLRERFGDGEGRIEYIDSPRNVGFGAGHNMTLDRLESRYHFVINPDILINEDTIGNMCRFMDRHPEVAIACPKVLNPDGTVQYIAKNRPSLLSLVSRRIHLKSLAGIEREYLMMDRDQDEEFEVDFCTGCFFVIRTEVFRRIGGFDKDYFLYFEDADITMKAKGYGRAYYAPSASVVHFWHRETAHSSKQFLIQLRSMFTYFGKWGFKLK